MVRWALTSTPTPTPNPFEQQRHSTEGDSESEPTAVCGPGYCPRPPPSGCSSGGVASSGGSSAGSGCACGGVLTGAAPSGAALRSSAAAVGLSVPCAVPRSVRAARRGSSGGLSLRAPSTSGGDSGCSGCCAWACACCPRWPSACCGRPSRGGSGWECEASGLRCGGPCEPTANPKSRSE